MAAAVAAVPPTVLLAAVHGVAVLVKANASGAVYRTAVAATAALAAGAFVLSFVALRDLAVLAGISPALAAISKQRSGRPVSWAMVRKPPSRQADRRTSLVCGSCCMKAASCASRSTIARAASRQAICASAV